MNAIKYPLTTEKSIRLMEAENKLAFMVDAKATKADIKKALEDSLGANVIKVNTLKTLTGKKAFVTFAEDTPAIDIATSLGLI